MRRLNKKILSLLLLLPAINMFAQPGEYGDYSMSFVLIDKTIDKIIDAKNKDFKVFPSYFGYEQKYEIGAFEYDKTEHFFSYFFEPTPVGAAVPRQFTINVICGNDTMKIYNAELFIKDTLYFQKGEFVASQTFHKTKSLNAYNSVNVLNKTVYDYELSKLSQLPYYNQTVFNYDNVMVFSLSNTPDKLIISYDFDILDSLLGEIHHDFSLQDTIFKDYFPDSLNWSETNAIVFAILSNLQVVNDKLWVITLNQNKSNRQIFISNNKGLNWKKVFSIASEQILDLRQFNENELFAFSENKIFHSSNSGETWSKNIIQQDSLNIVDLLIMNDSVGFFVNQGGQNEFMRFNPITGECTKLLGNFSADCILERTLNQRKNCLFKQGNAVVVSPYLFSNDIGNTWMIVNNERVCIAKNKTSWTIWDKGTEIEEEICDNCLFYCSQDGHIISLLQVDNKIKVFFCENSAYPLIYSIGDGDMKYVQQSDVEKHKKKKNDKKKN